MKSIVREYLAGLRERDELDVLLPDLLSELGFEVLTRPSRGTRQFGVDVSAVSPESWEGGKRLYLFSIKSGDLGRADWNSGEQSLPPSLDEIRDFYIGTHVRSEHKDLEQVICLTFGGEVKEAVSPLVTGYIKAEETESRTYQIWNGDKLAGLVLTGLLGEQMMSGEARRAMRKAIALVEEPEVSYKYFANLVQLLRKDFERGSLTGVKFARQLHVAIWMLYVWARDVENIESAYLSSELVLLELWQINKQLIGQNTRDARALYRVLMSTISLHVAIGRQFVSEYVAPYAGIRHGLSVAVASNSSVDVNLKLFDVVGRISMLALWLRFLEERMKSTSEANAESANVESEKEADEKPNEGIEGLVKLAASVISNNPILKLPVADHQTVDVVLFVLACTQAQIWPDGIEGWFDDMADRVDYSIRTRSSYPSLSHEYREIVRTRASDEEGFKEATAGSTLIPFLAVVLAAMGRNIMHRRLRAIVDEHLGHCSLQMLLPNRESDTHIYLGENHGVALDRLQISEYGQQPYDQVVRACNDTEGFGQLTAFYTGFWPIVLMASRHYRFPIPPQFWVSAAKPNLSAGSSE